MSLLQAPVVRRLPQLFSMIAVATGIQFIGAAQANPGGVPALYATKAEAEAAAKKHFNCTGAHQMGHQWMPCATHGQSNGQPQHNH
jgi:hypothetical protein